MHKNLLEIIIETNSFTNKIQINHPNSNRFIAQEGHLNNTKDDDKTQNNDVDNSEDESHDELESS